MLDSLRLARARRARHFARCLGVTAAALALSTHATGARASGLELPEGGAIAAGRAGAVSARPADPTTIIHNVAGMAALPGFQLTASLNLGFFNQCVQRAGNYDGSDMYNIDTSNTVFEGSNYANGSTPYPRQCNEPTLGLNPNLLATYRPFRSLAFGVGIYAPHATGREGRYLDRLMSTSGLAPSPLRYLLYEKALLVLHLNAAVAWAPVPWLRFGASLQPSYADLSYTTMVNNGTTSAQSPNGDISVRLHTQGWFPAGNFGLQFVPHARLTIGVSSHVNVPFQASGRATAVANVYGSPTNPDETLRPITSQFTIVSMGVSIPWNVRAGIRYAHPRAGATGRTADESGDRYALAGSEQLNRSYDPMRDDLFDIEIDGIYEQTSTLSEVNVINSGTLNVGGTEVSAPSPITLRSDYKNVFGVRVGGDFNVIANMLSLRAGVAFETGAQEARYVGIHLPSFDTLSLHAGATFRYRFFTASLAYANYQFFPIDARTTGDRMVVTPGGMPSCGIGRSGPGACQANRVLVEASHHVLSTTLGFAF